MSSTVELKIRENKQKEKYVIKQWLGLGSLCLHLTVDNVRIGR
jgi:hypothetical protein